MFGTVDFGLDEWCNSDGIREGRVDAGGFIRFGPGSVNWRRGPGLVAVSLHR